MKPRSTLLQRIGWIIVAVLCALEVFVLIEMNNLGINYHGFFS